MADIIKKTRLKLELRQQKLKVYDNATKKKMSKNNIRYKNGNARRKLRERVKAMGKDCALCGKPIDYSLPAGDDWAFELDEIIPVSRGGSPIDPRNVQPAHRICNRLKGNAITQQKKQSKKVQVGEIKKSRNWLEE